MESESRQIGGNSGWRYVAVVVLLILVCAAAVGFYLAATRRDDARHVEPRPQASPVVAEQPPTPPDTPQVFEGRTVRPDAAGPGLVLVGDDGSRHPITEDDASRMLFLDARLRERRLRLTAVVTPGSGALGVVYVQTVEGDQVLDVDYWCETCKISLNRPGPCYCCGEETTLRERPAR
jgi:hypothetical protein